MKQRFFSYDVILSTDRYASVLGGDWSIADDGIFSGYVSYDVYLPIKRKKINIDGSETSELIDDIKSFKITSLNLHDQNLGLENYIADPSIEIFGRKTTNGTKIGTLIPVIKSISYYSATGRNNDFYGKNPSTIDINSLPDTSVYNYVLLDKVEKPDVVIPEKIATDFNAWIMIDRKLIISSKLYWKFFSQWNLKSIPDRIKHLQLDETQLRPIASMPNLFFTDTILRKEWRIKLEI